MYCHCVCTVKSQESEGRDRTIVSLPGVQNDLITGMARLCFYNLELDKAHMGKYLLPSTLTFGLFAANLFLSSRRLCRQALLLICLF